MFSSTKHCIILYLSTVAVGLSTVSAFQHVGLVSLPTITRTLFSKPNTFTLSNTNYNSQQRNKIKLSLSATTNQDPLADLSDERKANLFQSLLRDLQIEGTPLLGCDATAVHTMSAALWTTMAELSENDDEAKVCLVMESIPVGALKAFEEDFTILKTQARLMAYLPELKRVSVSLIGKGVGPAFIVETSARTEKEIQEKNSRSSVTFDETKCTLALKSFIDRIVVNQSACPYTKNVDLAATGLEAKGVTPGPVAYRFNGSSDACAAVGAFWTW